MGWTFAQLPTTSMLAVLFYVAAPLILIVRPLRLWFQNALRFPQPSTGTMFGSVDAFRGFAALWIAMFHFQQWPRGYFVIDGAFAEVIRSGNKAVPIFVMISGLLIWRSVTAITSIDGLSGYARNRFLRVFPLYAAVTVVALVVGQVGRSMPAWQEFLATMLMARSYGSHVYIVPQFWSLYVEVIFYAAAPFIAFGLGRHRTPALFLVAALLFALAEMKDVLREFALWKYFFLGIAAAELTREPLKHHREFWALALGVIGVALIVLDFQLDWFRATLASFRQDVRSSQPEYTVGLGLGFFMLLIASVNSRLLSGILSITPLRILGVVSFGVFAWHGLMIVGDLPVAFYGFGHPQQYAYVPGPTAGWPTLFFVVVPALLTAGTISYLAIERPFLMLRKSRRAQPAPSTGNESAVEIRSHVNS